MSDDLTPTTLRQQLGAKLRQLRLDRGETAKEVASALRVSVSKVSRIESGARAVSELDLTVLVAHFEVSPGEATELLELAARGRRRREPIVSVDPDEGDFLRFVRSGFVELEKDALSIREFNEGVIPGLLQTPNYMRAMMLASAPADPARVNEAVALRIERQRRLARSGQYAVIIDESALLREVGGPAVMRGQLLHVLEQAEARSVDVRVIPLASGYHPAVNSSFVALSMTTPRHADIVFLEGLIGFHKLTLRQDVERIERVWSRLLSSAASATASLSMLASLSRSYEKRSR